MNIRSVLEHPLVYQSFQQLGGYFGARSKAMRAFLPTPVPRAMVEGGQCGPASASIALLDRPPIYDRRRPAKPTLAAWRSDAPACSWCAACRPLLKRKKLMALPVKLREWLCADHGSVCTCWM